MPIKNRQGNVLIPLLIVLALSVGVFMLAKSFANSQQEVETAINGRYEGYSSFPLSATMDPPDKWTTFEDKTYGFKLSYPQQWVGVNDSPENGKLPATFSRFLSNRIKLSVTVQKGAENLAVGKNAKFDKNDFYYFQDDDLQKGAYTIHNNLYYVVKFEQTNYFGTPLEFKSIFFQILKKFAFIN